MALPTTREQPGGAAEVGLAFLQLGLSSFGGPIAHLGYFQREFVERRHWIDAERFGQLLGLCQFLPGPASSQLGFCLGMLRAGWPGAFAAFIGFTLPSALLMFAFALSDPLLSGAWGQSAVHGLKLVAVAVVAQGVFGMARTLTPDPSRAMMAAVSAGLIAVSGAAWMQLLVVAGGAALGPWLCRGATARPGEGFEMRYGRRTGGALLLAFAILLALALIIAPTTLRTGQVAGAFYRAGALVFGGGHVVLPLLKQAVVEPGGSTMEPSLPDMAPPRRVASARCLASPPFLASACTGAKVECSARPWRCWPIFLPGFLLVAGVLPILGEVSQLEETLPQDRWRESTPP